MRDRHMGSGAGRRARAALWLVTLAVVLGAAARLEAAEQKIAVVDMQRALNECDAGKRAKDQVKAKFERSQNQLKKQREQGVALPSRTSPSEARAGGGRSRTSWSTGCSRSSRGNARSA